MRPIDDTKNLQRSALDRTNTAPPNKKNEAEKSENKPLTAPNSDAAIGNHKFYGQRQKERLNAELIAYGIGGSSAYRDVRLPTITKNANTAYQETFDKNFKKFADYSRALEKINDSITPAKVKTSLEAAVRRYDGAKSYPEVARRAENAYRAELRRAGFNAADVRGTSAFKAADFLMSRSNRSGQITTLSADQIRTRVANGDQPTYLVRLVEPKYMNSPDAKLAAPGKDFAWVASADELAGAKGDLFEAMRRIGYTYSYIKEIRDDITSGKRSVSDYSLAIVEADAAKGRTTPLWDTVISEVKGNPDFSDFKKAKPEFWEKVKNFQQDGMDYSAHVEKLGKTDIDVYTAKFPREQAKAFEARYQIDQQYGANPLFTGDGTTLRPDTQNGRVGAREWFVENIPLRDQQKTTLIPLQDLKLGENPTVRTQTSVRNVADNPLRLGGEMRGGAKAGGAIAAVTSLGEVYDRAKTGDYKGAATTFAVNAGAGAAVGGLSAGGERIVGRGIENALSRSNPASKGLERLYTNPAARNFVGRLAQTEGSAITSQTFNSTVRTVGGRVGGAGIIGGVVSGAFSAYDQIGAYRRNEVSGSQSIGTVVGEASVGVGAGMSGAAMGAAIGSIIPGAGTLVGGVVGFGVGMAAGYLADKGLRGLGVDKAIARGVTATIDAGSRAAGAIQKSAGRAAQAGRQYVNRQITQARAVYNSASSGVRSARTFVSQRVGQARRTISSGTRAAVNYVSQAGSRAVSAVRNTASQTVNQVRSTVNNVASQVGSTVNNIANQARSTVSNAVSNVANSAVSNLRSVFGW